MPLWTMWTHLLETALGFLGAHLGLSEAAAIIALTLMARTALMPVSLTAAYKAQKNKEAMERLKPELEKLRERLKDNQAELAAQTMALYRQHGITFMDKVSVLNMGSQGLFGLGIFQVLKRMVFSSRFLWIPNLARPDLALTILVGALMLLGTALMPGATGNASMLLMIGIPVVISVIAVATLPSALGLYWATSNAVTVVQALALRGLLARRRPLTA